ncbi:AAA family ATPase [Clostridium swellfunianum]|uniref:RNA polymerase recycling motor HelD n=1 Tax=Clostridium swellfunianum TaxID=1367462 RepID=UPI002030ACA5|nr:RNA polymerase recycling motor HelD [Clostridium swellfunianum]MCM0649897.1 AAA family ATPase [Clostridium swellfunianum]
MSALNHPDYDTELEKLKYTVEYVKNYNSHILNEKARIDREVDYGIKHYNSDNAEQFNDLIINTVLQDNMKQKLKSLERACTKPYFSRVDFTETGSTKQSLYIGKMSITRNADNEPIVIDWRAPIANLYYEGRLGSASYICPEGNVNGEIHLKRQYTIENASLQEIYDIDITTNDDFLQACLNSSKDNRLKDIVSTIQEEQNKVIRADMWKPLIVQGAAGGGKTTIALHRIAYLLYNYEKSFSPQNFMIIAPNRFFLSYISEVLPELGVENVKQTTFEDFAQEIIGHKFRLREAHEKLPQIISKSSHSNFIKNTSKFKSSLHFKEVVEKYMLQVELCFIPNEDFKVSNFTIISASELKSLFLEEYSNLPIVKRLDEIKKHLTNTLKRKKIDIIESITFECDRELEDIRYEMHDCPERRSKIADITNKRELLIEKIKNHSKTVVRNYMANLKPLSSFDYYLNLLSNKELFTDLSEGYTTLEIIDFTRISTINNLQEGLLEIEDLAPLMYIKQFVYGLDDKLPVRHIIIDEAQDFSLFQLFILKKLLNSSSFTILGDLCQGIHCHRGIDSWEEVKDFIFDDSETSLLTLEQSYRTTIEIMEAANSVIKRLNNSKLPTAKPVIRHGTPVTLEVKTSFEKISEEIKLKLESIQYEGFKSMALICKTLNECEQLKILLKGLDVKIKLITGKEKDYSGGIVIVPAYLVKGLEFDVVIIANASKEMFSTEELDVKLLYVAMTRPLHRLHIYSCGEPSLLLSSIK